MKKRVIKWNLLFFAIGIMILGALCALGSYYFVSMREAMEKQLASEVLELTLQGGHAFDLYLEKDKDLVLNVADNLKKSASDDEENIIATLTVASSEYKEYTAVDANIYVAYSDKAGTSFELSQRLADQFRALGESGIREPYYSAYTGLKMLGYYSRFKFSDGVDGIVQCGFRLTTLAEEFSLTFFDDTGFSYIVGGDGDIYVRSNNKNSNRTFSNIFEFIEISGNSKKNIAEFKKYLANDKTGVMQLTFNGAPHVFVFVPLKSIDGGYFISIIPETSITKNTDSILHTTQGILVMVVIALLMFIAIALVYALMSRKVRKKEAEVRYREELFGMLSNSTSDVFLMLDGTALSVDYVSPNIKRVLGIAPKDVRQNLAALGNLKRDDGVCTEIDDLMAIPLGGTLVCDGERVNNDTGVARWFSETVYRASVDDADKFIVVLSDRTAERQKEYVLKEAIASANAANESKSNFLSNMSHDIRTPMNAIVGLSTLLERDAEKPELVRDHADKISASGRHLLGLINDILDMSKIESGKTTLNVDEIELDDIIDEIKTIIAPQAEAKSQIFEMNIGEGVAGARFMGDRVRINQILLNILGNAVKYTPENGSVRMDINVRPQSNANLIKLRFVVADNGIGMSEEYLKKIFQPFTREETGMTGKTQGTGLGMSITKNLVDLMGGAISVESKQGEGSTFTVDLEFMRCDDAVNEKVHAVLPPTPDIELDGLKVLVAEDNPLNAEILTELLDMSGIKCDVAENGQVAVDMFAVAQPDTYSAILMDVQMPVMNGYEATRMIRASDHPRAATVPIIAMTANAFADDVKNSVDAGMNSHMSKPVDIAKLEAVLKKFIAEERANNR